MSAGINMLAAKKVKMHGMVSSRWKTKDKITQYKGLIKLYTRDKKIHELDQNVEQKKMYKELKTLQGDINLNRETLDNAIHGDKQTLRNILVDHKALQLAYQNTPTKAVIEMIDQVNFTKRKELDRLSYKMKVKSQELIDLKLRHAEIKDALDTENQIFDNETPEEKAAQTITARVQDSILKKEAALAIGRTYSQMIDIMKKDALYYDAILITIKNDGINQGKCMINATKLGQLATEYLDDRRREFDVLEKAVRRDMAQRKKDLAEAHEKVENFLQNIRFLLRRDSDINLCRVEEAHMTPSMLTLQDDITTIEKTLTVLKYGTFVPTFEAIYPCLQAQVEQNIRLQEFVKKCEENRDILLTKKNHAAVIKDIMESQMIDTTLNYKTEKNELKAEVAKQLTKKNEAEIALTTRHELLARIRISLKHLQYIAKMLEASKIKKHITMSRIKSQEEKPTPPPLEEIDASDIITELNTKFSKLIASVKDKVENKDVAYKVFETLIQQRSASIPLDKPIAEESLIEGVHLDSQILSREDIKKQSEEIVKINTLTDDLVPVFQTRRRKRFKMK